MEASYQENFGKQLQRLLNAVHKSRNKYQEANNIDSPEIRNLTEKVISERKSIESELINEINNLGGSADISAESANLFDSENSIGNKGKDQSVLEKIRSADRELLENYDDVLQGTILENVHLKTTLFGHRLLINEAFTELDQIYFSMFKTKEY